MCARARMRRGFLCSMFCLHAVYDCVLQVQVQVPAYLYLCLCMPVYACVCICL